MFTLLHLLDGELPNAGITRRLRLEVARRRTVRSLYQELRQSSLRAKVTKSTMPKNEQTSLLLAIGFGHRQRYGDVIV